MDLINLGVGYGTYLAITSLSEAMPGRMYQYQIRSMWCLKLKGKVGKRSLGCTVAFVKNGFGGNWLAHLRDFVFPMPAPEIAPITLDFDEYKRLVLRITSKQPIELLPGIEMRGNGWELDHAISIREGFVKGKPPEAIGHISNLWVIPRLLNRKKSYKPLEEALT